MRPALSLIAGIFIWGALRLCQVPSLVAAAVAGIIVLAGRHARK